MVAGPEPTRARISCKQSQTLSGRHVLDSWVGEVLNTVKQDSFAAIKFCGHGSHNQLTAINFCSEISNKIPLNTPWKKLNNLHGKSTLMEKQLTQSKLYAVIVQLRAQKWWMFSVHFPKFMLPFFYSSDKSSCIAASMMPALAKPDTIKSLLDLSLVRQSTSRCAWMPLNVVVRWGVWPMQGEPSHH